VHFVVNASREQARVDRSTLQAKQWSADCQGGLRSPGHRTRVEQMDQGMAEAKPGYAIMAVQGLNHRA